MVINPTQNDVEWFLKRHKNGFEKTIG